MEYILSMIDDHTYSEDSIIDEIVRLYPDHTLRKVFVNSVRPNTGGLTLLTRALSEPRRCNLARFLIRSGADPNMITHAGIHVLSFHAMDDSAMNDIDNVTTLLSCGADPNAFGQVRSVLYGSICFRGGHVTHVLLLHGARMSSSEYVTLQRDYPEKLKLITDFYDCVSLRRIAFHHITISVRLENLQLNR
jgi:ankyrin repeat protein